MNKWPDDATEQQMLKDACFIADGCPAEMRTSDNIALLLDRVRKLEQNVILLTVALRNVLSYAEPIEVRGPDGFWGAVTNGRKTLEKIKS